ncbi:hypothetical protein D3C81_984580 [compost metagenome]
MVGVDQPRNDHLAGHVQNLVGVLGQLVAGADLLDQVVFYEQAAASDLAALAVHRHQQFGVLYQQSLGHRYSFP